MRRLTHAQLHAELQVGTVDMAEVELVADLERYVAADGRTSEQIEDDQPAPLQADRQHEADEFLSNLQKQAASALATVVHDTRGAESVAVADQELPPYESQGMENTEADEGNRPSLAGGDMDQSGSEE